MGNRPILASSCAMAATAAEARFRVDILPRSSWRSSVVVALDPGASRVLQRVAEMSWYSARFLTLDGTGEADPGEADRGEAIDIRLRALDGRITRLAAELEDADLVVMLATDDSGALASAAIGMAAALRSVMTAGLVLDGGRATTPVVSALRPYARVLLVTRDEQDVTEVLQALRA
ncbi:MAG: 3-methyl-2-oxobutanoate hydroxymethyltransferase [Actinobacteria bacterium]|nr:3-methyl-2-oxobutanoate hydroxymethyltransferase [Actinomycetota bacterium]